MRRATIVGKYAENGQRIFTARRRKGFTQMHVCELAGVSHRQYVRLENGEHLPSEGLRDRLADTLGLERSEIKSGDDEDEESALPRDLDQALQVLARYVGRA
jgi:transcriptional regulator with XRE-family HTH domain